MYTYIHICVCTYCQCIFEDMNIYTYTYIHACMHTPAVT